MGGVNSPNRIVIIIFFHYYRVCLYNCRVFVNISLFKFPIQNSRNKLAFPRCSNSLTLSGDIELVTA